jgi:iron(III) transport system ATP-binding protein
MINIANLHVRYASEDAQVHAVRGIDINVGEGEFYTLLGPSGCGKTTTLRCLAGLESPSEGTITINGVTVFSANDRTFVPPYRRDIGMVFQSYAIWPHMTVFENVAFPLEEMRPSPKRAERRERVLKALALVQLTGFEDRPAPFLSGGQQQRLALARALVREPKVLLLDEPLSNLDAKLREETRAELRDLVKRLNITTVYVTHDQIEALTMADRVAVMENGLIVQEAAPRMIYQRPVSRFVANFIGQTNFVEGRVRDKPDTATRLGVIDCPCGALTALLPSDATPGETISLSIRPENIRLADGMVPDPCNKLEGQVISLEFLGDTLDCQLAVGDIRLGLRLHPSSDIRVGETVRVAIAFTDALGVRN